MEVNRIDLICCDSERNLLQSTKCLVLPHGEPSFLDFQEVREVDGQGMVVELLFSGFQQYHAFSFQTVSLDSSCYYN